MIKINIYITKEQQEALKEITNSRVSLSEHIRRAIDEYLETRQQVPSKNHKQ